VRSSKIGSVTEKNTAGSHWGGMAINPAASLYQDVVPNFVAAKFYLQELA
jgi:hypothetical protein